MKAMICQSYRTDQDVEIRLDDVYLCLRRAREHHVRLRRPERDDLCLRQLRPAGAGEQSGGGEDVDVCLR